jgi:hypothetical protein
MLYALHVYGPQAFLSAAYLETDTVSFLQRFETFHHQRAVMNEDILITVVLLDKPETLLVIKPLHCAFGTHRAQLLRKSVTMKPAPTAPSGGRRFS